MARHRAPIRQMTSQRLHIGQMIAHDALTHTMAAGTGPEPVWCILNNLCGNRSALCISHSDHQLRVVHRVAGKARLEKMPAPAFGKVDLAGITPMLPMPALRTGRQLFQTRARDEHNCPSSTRPDIACARLAQIPQVSPGRPLGQRRKRTQTNTDSRAALRDAPHAG